LTTQQFTFGDFVLDAGRRQVRGRDGALIPLTPRLFNALHLFVLRPGELLDKNELMRELWPGLVVEENSLSQVVSSLRRCLGEDGDQRRYIHTEPRRGFRFVAEVTSRYVVAAEASGGGTALPSRSKVAVLPFLNLSPRPTDDLLPVGMADSLISRLSTWPHLVVRLVSSVRRFADAPQDPIQAGRLLGVDWVVEGSLQHSGLHVRVAARLLSVADGTAAWSERFDEAFLGVFDVQDLIADRVAQALARHLPQLLPLESSVDLHRLGNTRRWPAAKHRAVPAGAGDRPALCPGARGYRGVVPAHDLRCRRGAIRDVRFVATVRSECAGDRPPAGRSTHAVGLGPILVRLPLARC